MNDYEGNARIAEQRERRYELVTRARDQYDLAHQQLDDSYTMENFHARGLAASRSIAHSLEAIVALKLLEVDA